MMVPTYISAPDAITPAFTRARQLLLAPFRWAIWWRLAIVSMIISGEFFGMMVRVPDVWNIAHSSKRHDDFLAARGSLPNIFGGMSVKEIAVLIAALVSLVLVLMLVHIYIGSVVRFILFDAVATGRYRLREGWKRWQPAGRRLFVFNLLLFLIFIVVMGAVVGVFAAGLIAMGVGKSGAGTANPAMAIASVLLLIPVILIAALLAYVVITIAYDLGLPMMALENISGTEAFGRGWRLVKTAKGDYAAYIGLKFVLGIALGIVMAIIQFMILFLVLLPAILVVVALGIGVPQLLANPVLLAALITVGVVLLAALSFVTALVSVPVLVIFQSYALIFLAPRYLPLYHLMYGAPPAPPTAELPPAVGPDFPPELAPTS